MFRRDNIIKQGVQTKEHSGSIRIYYKKKVLPFQNEYANIPFVACADIAQSVERILGKDEVGGSNPPISFELKPFGINSFLRVFSYLQT